MRLAVLIPCYNEALTVAGVVEDFRRELPEASIFVYDNNSADQTFEEAVSAGAITRREAAQGKGHVVRRMFADIDADFYLLVDGDATYDATAAPELLKRACVDGLDMVVAARIAEAAEAYRRGHRLGNQVLTGLVIALFGRQFSDMLSGYRVFSRRFVKSFPVVSSGFEIETELTVHALQLKMPITEVQTRYFSRPEGSVSALKTYQDGVRILLFILRLVKQERPILFFGLLSVILLLLGLGFGAPVLAEYFRTHLVPRLPTAVLATGLILLSAMAFFSGLILDTVALTRMDTRRLAYLRLPGPLAAGDASCKASGEAFRRPAERV